MEFGLESMRIDRDGDEVRTAGSSGSAPTFANAPGTTCISLWLWRSMTAATQRCE